MDKYTTLLNKDGRVRKSSERFDFDKFYQRLLLYKEKHGDIDVPLRYICKDGYRLGSYVSRIRLGKTQKSNFIKLDEEKTQRLNEIGFKWNLRNVFDFEEFFEHLELYKRDYGNVNVPFKYVCKDGYSLGPKVSRIRYNLKNESIKITSLQKEKLEKLGFKTQINEKFDYEKYFRHLQAYFLEHKNLNFKYKYVCEDGYGLGEKTIYVKNLLNNNKDKFTIKQLEELEKMGMNVKRSIVKKRTGNENILKKTAKSLRELFDMEQV